MRNIKTSLFLLLLLFSVNSFSYYNKTRYKVCKTFPTGSGCEATEPSCSYEWSEGSPCSKYDYWGKCGKDANGKEITVKMVCNATEGIALANGYPNISNISSYPVLSDSKYKFHMLVYGKLSVEIIATGQIIDFLNLTTTVGSYANQTMSIIPLGNSAYKMNFTDYDTSKTIDAQHNGVDFFFTDAEIQVVAGLMSPDSITYSTSANMYVDLQNMGENAVTVGPVPADNLLTITSYQLLLNMPVVKTISIVPLNLTSPIITVTVQSLQTLISTYAYSPGYYRLIYKVADYEYKNILIQITH